jgi:DNA-binding phage protein
MALTKDFKETVQKRALRDPDFRLGLLEESIDCLLSGELDTGKTLLRDYINATIGFEALAYLTNKSPKSLMRMFSPAGNPRADNLLNVIAALQEQEGVQLQVRRVEV